MKIAVASALVLVLVALVGAGVLAVRGVGAAVAFGLETARPLLEQVPGELAPERVAARLDRAAALLRDGTVDGTALRDMLAWLPAALLDGQLDASEVGRLERELERILGSDASGGGAAEPAG